MKKEEVRKEYFKLRIKGHTNNQCRKILFSKLGYEINIRTLRRWTSKLNNSNWDLRDKSRRPKLIHHKINPEIEKEVITLRQKTGWGDKKIENFLDVSHTSINKILRKNNLTNPTKRKKKRIKYIRWQREHPNSLWQMDISDQKVEGKYCFAVVDDCERYCLGLFALNKVSTNIIIHLLDTLFKIHGKPREILTDNGNVFGLRSKHSKFDIWCRRRHVRHIRTAIHSPTTTGKIERFFQTLEKELPFCNKNLEFFRMRYNHFRPHSSLNGKCPADIYFAFYKLF